MLPLVYRSEIIHIFSHFRKIGAFAIRVPWPFHNRQAFITVSAMPWIGKDNNTIMISIRSISDIDDLKNIKPFKQELRAKNVTINFCSFYIETDELKSNKHLLKFVCNGDPNISYLPNWLLNKAIKFVAIKFI